MEVSFVHIITRESHVSYKEHQVDCRVDVVHYASHQGHDTGASITQVSLCDYDISHCLTRDECMAIINHAYRVENNARRMHAKGW